MPGMGMPGMGMSPVMPSYGMPPVMPSYGIPPAIPSMMGQPQMMNSLMPGMPMISPRLGMYDNMAPYGGLY